MANGHVRAEENPAPAAGLDGWVFTLGPQGHASRREGVWDSGFGAEAGIYFIRESRVLAAIGGSGGGTFFSAESGGRAWVQIEAASYLGGLALGLAAGPALELDPDRPPRVGGQASLWVFAGVLPFVRVGAVERTGIFAELGVRIALPVLRWGQP